MARKVSPFAELTHGEQQIRWLEYQSIRLPYNEAVPEPKTPNTMERVPDTHRQGQEHEEHSTHQPQPVVTPPPEVFCHKGGIPAETVQRQGAAALAPAPQPLQMEQKTRHRQYDAVIEKMKQAERRAGGYQVWSK